MYEEQTTNVLGEADTIRGIWKGYNLTLSNLTQPQSVFDFYIDATIKYDYVAAYKTVSVPCTPFPTVNLPPGKVQLYSPPSGNITLNRIPTFVWYNTTDPENNPLTYQFQLSNSSNFNSTLINTANIAEVKPLMNLTSAFDLPTDTVLYWRVRAYDGSLYSNWSDVWNLTIQSSLILSLTVNSVDFGTMAPGETNDTSDESPLPLLLQNDGNVLVDAIISGTDLWQTISNPSSYYRYKIRANESNAFNTSLSTMTWTNMLTGNVIVDIASFNYRDESDNAKIDLKVTVPSEEPAGPKNSTVTITAEAA